MGRYVLAGGFQLKQLSLEVQNLRLGLSYAAEELLGRQAALVQVAVAAALKTGLVDDGQPTIWDVSARKIDRKRGFRDVIF